MLFHADRNVKDNLLQMYKKEALDHHQKKSDIRTKRVNEERELLDNFNRREQQDEDRRKLEKYKRVTETMNEYKELMSHKDQTRLKPKNNEVNFNTYGVSVKSGVSQNLQNLNQNFSPQVNAPFLQNYHPQVNAPFLQNSHPQNYNVQNLNEIFPNLNTNNLPSESENSSIRTFGSNDMSRVQKHEQQKYYKDYLDSQVIITNLGLSKTP